MSEDNKKFIKPETEIVEFKENVIITSGCQCADHECTLNCTGDCQAVT